MSNEKQTWESRGKAPVQKSANFVDENLQTTPMEPPMPNGWIDWVEHCEAWKDYDRRFHTRQSAERIAERSGFSYAELLLFLGHKPKTWRART